MSRRTQRKRDREERRRVRTSFIVVLELILILVLLPVYAIRHHQTMQAQNMQNEETQVTETAAPVSVPQPTPSADVTTPDSLIFIANKKHPLPQDYEPSDLRQVNVSSYVDAVYMRSEAADALERMFAAASADGVTLLCNTGYRSYDFQNTLYTDYAARDGQAEADRYSSRPGYSDHQTGLAVDIGDHDEATIFTADMADTPEGQWLYHNAHTYGFVLRYPQGKEDITGYEFEPWHYRYIGVENAEKVYAVSPDETLEEYYGVSGGDYEN